MARAVCPSPSLATFFQLGMVVLAPVSGLRMDTSPEPVSQVIIPSNQVRYLPTREARSAANWLMVEVRVMSIRYA
ncbi:hypothetical protein D3C79_855270 [compost metagenome]